VYLTRYAKAASVTSWRPLGYQSIIDWIERAAARCAPAAPVEAFLDDYIDVVRRYFLFNAPSNILSARIVQHHGDELASRRDELTRLGFAYQLGSIERYERNRRDNPHLAA
jgi:hypothetical protein